MTISPAGAARLSTSTLRCSLRSQGTFRPVQLATQQVRNASDNKAKKQPPPAKKVKKRTTFITHDLKKAEQFSLCDAVQYIRAFELGNNPRTTKYEVHVKLDTLKNGPAVRNRIQLPNAVSTEVRIAAIVDPKSKAGQAAKSAGAHLVGEDEIFQAVRDGKIDFDKCVCHPDSLAKLNGAKIARILGPRGLMPSAKTGTVASDLSKMVKDMVGASEYRERVGVIRVAIGQLGFTPEQLSHNLRFFMDALRKDLGALSDKITKSVHEVVLSSTNSPGFSLNGQYRTEGSVGPQDLEEKES